MSKLITSAFVEYIGIFITVLGVVEKQPYFLIPGFIMYAVGKFIGKS